MTTPGSSTQAALGSHSLDDILTRITTETNQHMLNVYLKSKDVSSSVLAGTLSNGQDPLAVLDPHRNTLGYLYILAARLNSNTAPPPSLSNIQQFCAEFEPAHARYAPDRVTMLAKGILRAAEGSGNPKYALSPLSDLTTRYPPNLHFLTTLHPMFLRLCVSTGHYSKALPVLTVPIMQIDTTLSELTYNDNLIYHYAGGIALGALKRWQQAEEFFEICVCAPAQVPAALQFEAYKKLVLVQLILYGEPVPPPKYSLPALQRAFKNSQYQAFVKMYPGTPSALRTWASKEHDMLNQERNLGLVNQAIERAPVWLIKKLTATYLTLGLGDIGHQVGIDNPEEVRDIILAMIESGEINGSISAEDTVTFADPVPQFSKADLDAMLVAAQENSRALQETERALNASKEYLTKAMRSKDDPGWGADEDIFPPGMGLGALSGPGGMWAEEMGF